MALEELHRILALSEEMETVEQELVSHLENSRLPEVERNRILAETNELSTAALEEHAFGEDKFREIIGKMRQTIALLNANGPLQ